MSVEFLKFGPIYGLNVVSVATIIDDIEYNSTSHSFIPSKEVPQGYRQILNCSHYNHIKKSNLSLGGGRK